MKPELEKVLREQRKRERQVSELKKTKEKMLQQKAPDQKVLAMIEEELRALTSL